MEHIDHILIVDDDREIRELVSAYLKKNGLRVTPVADGRQMRTFLEANTVDLIILDLMMPGDDGLVLSRELRVGRHKATPIVMLTARSDEMDRIIGWKLGADDYIAKPFSARELLARIKAVLRARRMLPANLQVSEGVSCCVFGQWRLDTTARHLIDAGGTCDRAQTARIRLLRVFVDTPSASSTRSAPQPHTGREAELFDDRLISWSAGFASGSATMPGSRPISRPSAAKAMFFRCRSRS